MTLDRKSQIESGRGRLTLAKARKMDLAAVTKELVETFAEPPPLLDVPKYNLLRKVHNEKCPPADQI